MRVQKMVPWLFLSMAGSDDVQARKQAIIYTLSQKNPTALPEFAAFFTKYDQLVTKFFDTTNYESLEAHTRYMEKELHVLRAACNDNRFKPVRDILVAHYHDVEHLVAVLKEYRGSRDAISLALKVRGFKFLLPPDVKKRGDIALFFALKHRLSC